MTSAVQMLLIAQSLHGYVYIAVLYGEFKTYGKLNSRKLMSWL